VLGNQGFTEFVGQAVNKGMDFGLLAIFPVGYDALKVSVEGHELLVGLREAVQLSLGGGLMVRFSIEGFQKGDEVVNLLTWQYASFLEWCNHQDYILHHQAQGVYNLTVFVWEAVSVGNELILELAKEGAQLRAGIDELVWVKDLFGLVIGVCGGDNRWDKEGSSNILTRSWNFCSL
jgi:hypothetical protein